jgi:hypothetical protein
MAEDAVRSVGDLVVTLLGVGGGTAGAVLLLTYIVKGFHCHGCEGSREARVSATQGRTGVVRVGGRRGEVGLSAVACERRNLSVAPTGGAILAMT